MLEEPKDLQLHPRAPPSMSGKCLIPEALDVLVRNEIPDEQVPIVLIELPLLSAQQVVVQGVAGTHRDTLTMSGVLGGRKD